METIQQKKETEEGEIEEMSRPPSPNTPPPGILNKKELISGSPNDNPLLEEKLIPRSPSNSPPPLQETESITTNEKKNVNPKKDFEAMVEYYLANNTQYRSNQVGELEIRFGTNPKTGKALSKIDYDNVVQLFYSSGFHTENTDGLSILRIQCEDLNRKTGQVRISNIRAEVMGLDLIQEYCRHNNLQKVIDLPSTASAVSDKIKFTQKHPPYIGDNRETSKPLRPVDFSDFNFRVSYQIEKDFYAHSNTAKRILENWLDSKKIYRYINRVRLSHPDFPIFLDISIVKESSRTYSKYEKKIMIPQYTIQEANVFNNEENYEVELEIDNSRVGPGREFPNTESVMNELRKCIRLVLSGLQGTNFPISNSEKSEVLKTYFDLVFEENYAKEFLEKYNNDQRSINSNARRKLAKHFIGPSSYTLQMSNVIPIPEEQEGRTSLLPNIRENYTVTDKADGERKLLYVSPNGNMYMIDTNMNIIFTGIVTTNKELFNSLLDGEHIKHDKNNTFINLYAAFDIYYKNGKSVRELDFLASNEEVVPEKFRLPLLNDFVKQLKPISILNKDSGNSNPDKQHGEVKNMKHACWLNVTCKKFYSSYQGNIFTGCSSILSKVRDGSYQYNTDGLIFTPASTGVGGERSEHSGPLQKFTWDRSFKWKPAEFNTIDFLVTIKKNENGKDEIHHIFQDGKSLNGKDNLVQYKTLVLRCGFSKKDHGYLNPMLDVINDEISMGSEKDDYQKYKPVPFQPSNPYDPEAYYCNVALKDSGNGLVMLTEENEYFDENMIVEFSYDRSKTGHWRWIPLRVRYDKTNDLRNGGTNFGNAYHVANNNWYSIHNPITQEMITTGLNIPSVIDNDEVYYNTSNKETNTEALRNFHNLYVKTKLIVGVSDRGNTLIDYAVGKGGDFPKWISSNLEFVFGIDVSKDNIENQLNGAYARYLNYRGKYKKMPRALFVHGNSGLHIRSGKALVSERDKQISSAVFGNGIKEKDVLGEGVYKDFGIGKDGFDISSCQFALHYFFGGGETQAENENVLHTFLRNVCECTKVNGYFIGTCYDGQTVFNILKSKNKGESMTLYNDSEKIYEITKQYSNTGFPEDEHSLGYRVDVYQESINKEFPEYLVNFVYLQRVLENYGFTLISKEEAQSMNLPNGSGLFDELFSQMNTEITTNFKQKKEYRNAEKMSLEEKKISFMNRYFVFRKTHNVNAEKIYKEFINRATYNEPYNEEIPVSELIDKVETDNKEFETAQKSKQSIIIRRLPGKKQKIIIGNKIISNEPGIQIHEKRVIIKKNK